MSANLPTSNSREAKRVDEVDGKTSSPRRPLLLDLFCGAGGCAVGYHRAGFDVVGVDIKPQPRYPFKFIQADAIEFLRDLESESFDHLDAIHASPPCQAYTKLRKRDRRHPDLVGPVQRLLNGISLPFVIENVPGAPLRNPIILCGSSFGLDVRRHRLFESNTRVVGLPCNHAIQTPRFRSLDLRQKGLACVVGVHGSLNYKGELEIRRKAMGIDWMTNKEITQAIPPAYTEYIGKQLLASIGGQR